ncbi:hypothetical protein [Bremerella cremea]|uniref:hypothetical protein n=1 Tax=Bremerella cremea TaxID=1031537 RepID=UPI0031F10F8E
MERHNTPVSPELRGICLSLAVGGTALLATVSLVACGIRLSTEGLGFLSSGPALAITLLTAAWCASIRAAWLVAAPKDLGDKFHALIGVAPFCCAILLARSVTFQPITAYATFLLWFAALAQEGITLSLFVSTLYGDKISPWLQAATEKLQTKTETVAEEAPAATEPAMEPTPEPAAPVLHVASLEAEEPVEEALEEESLDLPLNVTQQLTRGVEFGQEQIHGLVRATFTPGQRHAYLHVGFCPPLPAVPHVELHQLEGPEVQIKPGQVLSNGVRFDLKLRDASTVEALPVFEFMAFCPIDTEKKMREAC